MLKESKQQVFLTAMQFDNHQYYAICVAIMLCSLYCNAVCCCNETIREQSFQMMQSLVAGILQQNAICCSIQSSMQCNLLEHIIFNTIQSVREYGLQYNEIYQQTIFYTVQSVVSDITSDQCDLFQKKVFKPMQSV